MTTPLTTPHQPEREIEGVSASAGSIGFACVWDEDRDQTWSHIPANLLYALLRHAPVVDVEPEPSRPLRRFRTAINRRAGQPLWVPHPWNFVLRRREIERQMRLRDLGIALEINDLAVIDKPYWVYRDMTWRQVAAHGGDTATGVINPRLVRIQLRHEERVYRRANGVFAFSEWAARSVQEVGATRTVVVHPGVNVPVDGRTRASGLPRLLFVGRAFERKGGPLVLDALALLRRRLEVELDVVGPPPPPRQEWPDGVHFHGSLPPADAARLFRHASLFVMPSRFEAYGIALLEALVSGLPCIARDVCAMPEILEDGKWGVLIASEDPVELAAAIEGALRDGTLRRRVEEAREGLRRYYSWDRAALQMLEVLMLDLDEAERAAQFRALIPAKPS